MIFFSNYSIDLMQFLWLFQTMGHAGDGYKDDPTPHTVKEKFLGVNVNNATWVSIGIHLLPSVRW